MIHNPPPIVYLLRAYQLLLAHGTPQEDLAPVLATLLRNQIGHLVWPEFQAIYHLYLQAIPLPTARAAWGLNEARQERMKHTAQNPKPRPCD